MAHRLHIRILKGDEEAMGPIWFFEGFAIYAAGQFENRSLKLNADEIREIVKSESRGSYVRYGAVIRYFLEKAAIHELVQHAGQRVFFEWLQKLI